MRFLILFLKERLKNYQKYLSIEVAIITGTFISTCIFSIKYVILTVHE